MKPPAAPTSVAKPPTQTPKAAVAAPVYPTGTPHTSTSLPPQTTTRDISQPSATLAGNPVGHENYYAGDITHDVHGNPIQPQHALNQDDEGVAGTIHDLASRGLAPEIDAPQYHQEDQSYGG